MIKEYKNRITAIKKAKQVNGTVTYKDKPAVRKIKNKRTGRTKYKPIIRTTYIVQWE
jgi:hypothetical protein